MLALREPYVHGIYQALSKIKILKSFFVLVQQAWFSMHCGRMLGPAPKTGSSLYLSLTIRLMYVEVKAARLVDQNKLVIHSLNIASTII